jgi:hypothetical protein
LFFGIAYLFAFTLAFHDKYAATEKDKADRPALSMANLKSIDDPPDIKPQEESKKVDRFSFYFNSGEARFRTTKLETCDEQSPPTRQWETVSRELKRNGQFNNCNLRAIVKRIKTETGEGKQVRVTLVGHGDSEPVGRRGNQNSQSSRLLRYLSNYELSEARGQNVKYEILKMVPDTDKWQNIEWVILPASNEDLQDIKDGLIHQNLFNEDELMPVFTNNEIVNKTISPDQLISKFGSKVFAKLDAKMKPEELAEEQRVVLASIKPIPDHIATLEMKQINQDGKSKPLGLMDYMYFSIYTITTTGYGDIVPTTAYAKFLTSLANFCEVVFLVVFFNALISLKPTPPLQNVAQEDPNLPERAAETEVATNLRQGTFGGVRDRTELT